MKKIVDFIKWPLAYPVIGLGIVYVVWLINIRIAWGGDDIFTSFIVGIILYAFYFAITIFTKATSYHKPFSIILLIVTFLIGSIFGVFLVFIVSVGIEAIGDLIKDYAPQVYISLIGGIILPLVFLVWSFYRFYFDHQIIKFFLSLVALIFLSSNILYLCAYFPNIEARAELGDYRYYIVSQNDPLGNGDGLNVFYKCRNWSFFCTNLIETDSAHGYESIIIDKEKDEVSLIDIFGNMSYTDGENPRAYFRGVAKLQDHYYQLSAKCKNDAWPYDAWPYYCQTYIISINQCRLDHTGCGTLPMKYIIYQYPENFSLESNDETNEFSLYDGYEGNPNRKLIYTYGPHPRCYVNGCTITSNQ